MSQGFISDTKLSNSSIICAWNSFPEWLVSCLVWCVREVFMEQ